MKSTSPTLAEVGSLYDLEADGFPAGTRFMWPDELGWNATTRSFRVALWTPIRGGAWVTAIDLEPIPYAFQIETNAQAAIKWVISQLERLRQLHWFGMVYERGGYC